MILDNLDKRILQQLSVGTSSYEELARTCDVTRNTVYRRIHTLEDKGIIKNTNGCTINLDQLDLTPIIVGVKIPRSEQEKALNLLAVKADIKFIWKTYGDYDMTIVAFCPKGNEGEIIQDIKATLEELNSTTQTSVSVGYLWEKADLTPFPQEQETVKEEKQMMVYVAEQKVRNHNWH